MLIYNKISKINTDSHIYYIRQITRTKIYIYPKANAIDFIIQYTPAATIGFQVNKVFFNNCLNI